MTDVRIVFRTMSNIYKRHILLEIVKTPSQMFNGVPNTLDALNLCLESAKETFSELNCNDLQYNQTLPKKCYSQKKVFYKRRCSENFHTIHRKTPAPELLFNKVASLSLGFPMNFAKILRGVFLQNISRRLLLFSANFQ